MIQFSGSVVLAVPGLKAVVTLPDSLRRLGAGRHLQSCVI